MEENAVEVEWPFDREDTEEFNRARLAHLEWMRLGLYGRRVLELGCGIGKLTHFFEERKCEVISTDGRIENVMENLKRHPYRQGKVFVADVLVPGSHDFLGKFEFVFCYGLLYHTDNPALCIYNMSNMISLEGGVLILSSMVHPEDNGQVNYLIEDNDVFDVSLHGGACRPARDWIWNELSLRFHHVYLPTKVPKHHQFAMRWPALYRISRAIFVASKGWRYDTPAFVDRLLMAQDSIRDMGG